jgi:acyl carrier protein
MTDPEIYRQVNVVFRDVFDDPALEIRPETSASDIADWTSFNHVTLIVACEQKFGVKFSTSDIEALKNVGDLVGVIKRKLAQA